MSIDEHGSEAGDHTRANALFEGSRLYRQAEEGSRAIKAHFLDEARPIEAALIAVTGAASYRFTCAAHCREALNRARAQAEAKARLVAPYISIPVLLEAAAEFYSSVMEPIWLGTALKLTMALVWNNVYASPPATSKSHSQLIDAIAAAALFELIDNLERIYALSGEEDGLAEVKGNGLGAMSDHLEAAKLHYLVTFHRRGRILRTAAESMRVLMLDLPDALQAIENVLRGHSPASQRQFQSTLFAMLTESDGMEFWAQLWVRLQLRELCSLFRAQVSENPRGIALFEPFGLPYVRGIDGGLIQRAVRDCLWTREWYDRQRLEDAGVLKNMIVERAVARVSTDVELYVSSAYLLGDSLNWFIEASVFGYPGGVTLSQNVFRLAISEPFEEDICALFRKYGFAAGRVTERGAWLVPGRIEVLSHDIGTPIPGEMDALAYRESTQELVLCECKVLRFPFTKNQARNVLEKVTSEFNADLREKIDWMRKCDSFPLGARNRLLGLIVLDRPLPGMLLGEFQTVDADTLSEALEQF